MKKEVEAKKEEPKEEVPKVVARAATPRSISIPKGQLPVFCMMGQTMFAPAGQREVWHTDFKKYLYAKIPASNGTMVEGYYEDGLWEAQRRAVADNFLAS
jgi:hypothetical protein